MKELGDGAYDELEIDPSDYDSLPAYDFYDEVVLSCRVVHPEIIKWYLLDHSRETLPGTDINCNRMRQFVLYLAQRYKGQYEA